MKSSLSLPVDNIIMFLRPGYLCSTLAEYPHCGEASPQLSHIDLPVSVGVQLLEQVLVESLAAAAAAAAAANAGIPGRGGAPGMG